VRVGPSLTPTACECMRFCQPQSRSFDGFADAKGYAAQSCTALGACQESNQINSNKVT